MRTADEEFWSQLACPLIRRNMNPTLLLKRISMVNDGTFGVLIDENNIPMVLTLERPWLDNQNNVSSIPSGIYTCQITSHPEHGTCYQVMNVQDRTDILLHPGNTIADSEGCILIGNSYSNVPGMIGVGQSVVAYTYFMNRMKGYPAFTLKIVEAY